MSVLDEVQIFDAWDLSDSLADDRPLRESPLRLIGMDVDLFGDLLA